MRYAIAMTSLMAVGVFFTSCGRVGKSVSQRLEEPRLMKTWASECSGSKILGGSVKSYLKFTGTEFTQVHEFFNTATCGDSLAQVIYRGTFDLGEKLAEGTARDMDLDFRKATILPLNEAGRKALETVGLCDRSGWEIGKEKEVSPEAGGLTCPLKKLPRKEYTSYRLDGNVAYFGDLDLANSNTDPAKRNRALEEAPKYWESDVRLP